MSTLARFAFTISGAAALLVGCGAPDTPGKPQPLESAARQESSVAYCLTSPCIYVTTVYKPVGVLIYSLDQHGLTRPIGRIQGPNTGLYSPGSVALDADHNVYVADANGYYVSSIKVYPAGQYGNVAPVRTITGADTRMGAATGVAVDSTGNIHVTNWFGGTPCIGSVTVYAAGANGDAPPIAEIKGHKTRLCDPRGIAVDPSGDSYVTSGQQYSSSVNIYTAGANGNVPPLAAISGKRTRLYDPGSITLDAGNNIYVAGDIGGSLFKFHAGAHGNAKPIQAIAGSLTKLRRTYGVAVDPSGEIYANNGLSRNIVIVFASDANGDVRPIRTIRRGRKSFENPTNIAIR